MQTINGSPHFLHLLEFVCDHATTTIARAFLLFLPDLPGVGAPRGGGHDGDDAEAGHDTAAGLHTVHLQRESQLSDTPGEDQSGESGTFIRQKYPHCLVYI